MMKLMKFLVVALVAGGVCAPVPSQANETNGKAIMCQRFVDNQGEPITYEQRADGKHLDGFHFFWNQVEKIRINIYSRNFQMTTSLDKYIATNARIFWRDGVESFSLDRRTLLLRINPYGDAGATKKYIFAPCELIDPKNINAYFQPYIDFDNTLDDKARAGNKI